MYSDQKVMMSIDSIRQIIDAEYLSSHQYVE